MKKIGLAVVTYKDNFGSALQTYATQRILNEMGYETGIFDIGGVYREINKRKTGYYLTRMFYPDERKYLFDNLLSRSRKKANVASDRYAEDMRVRHQAYADFNKEKLKFFGTASGWKELSLQSESCDHVVVGSDQLWRPSNIAGGYFTLEFVPNQVNKIALSTSFGVSTLPKSLYRHAARYLNRINSISVREETGKMIVKELTGRDVPVVCDPTMLLDIRQWASIQKQHTGCQSKYILIYFMGDNPRHREFVKKLQAKTGYPVIGLLHGATYVAGDEDLVDEAPYDVGPGEFISLIREARYVCTDSFHGTVFSILSGAEFFTFRRYEDNTQFSTNSRIHTLLGWTGLSSRLLSGDEDISMCLDLTIDHNSVEERVEQKRYESMEYLRTALANGERR